MCTPANSPQCGVCLQPVMDCLTQCFGDADCQAFVTPLGLKTSATKEPARGMIGMFPVLSETPDRVVAGFNDKHLDFRVVVDVATFPDNQQVTATTLVLTHNLLGRIYLAIIKPFHRLIVPAMMRQILS